jgi:glyoxylase-like metal-dependent hydrolase (beta-lactamase superfamily II)
VTPTRALAWAAGGLTGAALAWLYISYVRQTARTLAPGIYAVFGGGGNSLLVQDGSELLLIDPKFAPGSHMLRWWIGRTLRAPVTTIVNTHYHYDHTYGNTLYPRATILAHERVPELMWQYDADWWSTHADGVPTRLIPDEGRQIRVGRHEVRLLFPGPAHTHGDLYAYLPNENIVVIGDLIHHTYYPFFDTEPGGTVVSGLIAAMRHLATTHPDARFLPGHGPLASARDLLNYALYLEHLESRVGAAIAAGLTEDEAVKRIDLRGWRWMILPSFHRNRLTWATAHANVRLVYRLQTGRFGGSI